MYLSFSSVKAVCEQVKMTYRRDGVDHDYFMDLVVEYRCGHRKAIAMKATEEDALLDETKVILKLLGDQDKTGVAHDYRLVTFEGLDPVTVTSASLIARCGRALDHEAQQAVRAVLPGLGPEVTAAEIGKASGYGARGVRAAFALIPAGLLKNPPGVTLHLDTPLTNRACRQNTNQAA